VNWGVLDNFEEERKDGQGKLGKVREKRFGAGNLRDIRNWPNTELVLCDVASAVLEKSWKR